jgi:hypothetical protein
MTAGEANQAKALTILADCPIGATHHALLARQVTAETLDALVRDGVITTRLATMANPKGLEVRWYCLARRP